MRMKTYLGTTQTKSRILNAIRELSEIVQVTLGPGGRPVLLARDNQPPLTTKDGVTVARHFQANGDIEETVARAALEICERTVRQAGDGTTTAIVLGAALVEAGQSWLELHPEYSPQQLSRELKEIYTKRIKPEILKLARPIKNLPLEQAKEAVRHVALISANHDEEIADAVAEAVEYVGEDGMCIAEEGAGTETRVVHQDGFSFNTGLSDLGGSAAASFINRNDYGDCVVEGAYVCLYDGEVNDPTTITPLLERVASEIGSDGRAIRSPIVIFAHRFSDQVLKMMAQNFRRGVLLVVPVMTPRNGQANGRAQFLHDLAAYVGGKVFDAQGAPLQEAHIPQLGFADSFKIGRSEGVILGEPNQELIEGRIADLKKQMEGQSEFDQDLIRYRIGRLTGGVATIYAGGTTAFEAKERHARVVDAISAVRAAMDQGVVPGGGATLATIADGLVDKLGGPSSIFAEALIKPFYQILENVGVRNVNHEMIGMHYFGKDGEVTGSQFEVYDALKRQHVEWYSGGIVDPARVTIAALENALSVAQLLMTCGGVIAYQEDSETAKIRAMQDGMLKAIEGDVLA